MAVWDTLAKPALPYEFAYDEPVARRRPTELSTTFFQPSKIGKASSFLFGDCCAPPARDTLSFATKVPSHETTTSDEGDSSVSFVAQLMAAEAASAQILDAAREKRRAALERAKQEALHEAQTYEYLFATEFEKLEQQHRDDLERFETEADRKVEKHLARDKKRAQKRLRDAILFVLRTSCVRGNDGGVLSETTCDVTLEIQKGAAASLGGRPYVGLQHAESGVESTPQRKQSMAQRTPEKKQSMAERTPERKQSMAERTPEKKHSTVPRHVTRVTTETPKSEDSSLLRSGTLLPESNEYVSRDPSTSTYRNGLRGKKRISYAEDL